MALLVEQMQFVEGFPPVDLQTGANSGDYVHLADYNHVAVIFVSGVGTNGDDPTLTIQQATDVSGTSVKALNFTTIYKKQAATNLSSTAAFTKVTQAAGNTYTNTDAAEQSAMWIVEFDASDLDVANGFDCLRATVADIGTNAQPGYLLYVLSEPRYNAQAANMPTAIS